jgi:dTDP-4-amino-4,6-dideoxygalactose transaminase
VKQIPFHRPYITDDEISEVVDSLKSGWITMGPRVIRFEEDFCRYIGSKNSVSVNSCTAALHLALKAVNLKPNDEVIIPTMTFTATAEVVCYFGANPVIVDVERDTLNIDFSVIEKAITPQTKAVIPVHYAGQPCDMDEIIQIAKKNNLFVIEDAAHSLPAWYKGTKVGTLGDITCFSFYATKTLTTGEGGMATTENGEWAEKIRIMRLHGISKDAWKRNTQEGSWQYEVVDAGYKYNMTDMQAALGLAQLKKVEWMWEKRKEIADKYTAAFRESESIVTPHVKQDRISAWHLYVIKLNIEVLNIDRNSFIEELKKRAIGTSVHFIPIHRHPFYRNTFGYRAEDFPVAEKQYERIISLPIYPGMTDNEIEFVIESVDDVCRKFKR